jgi:hypothetical protein
LLLSTAPLARGHAILLAAKPASGQVVSGPKIEVNLRFNSRIDAQRSRLTVAGSDGKPRSLPIGSQSSPDSLGAEANGLEIGAYVLRWQVLAVDGHITRGEVPFRVR